MRMWNMLLRMLGATLFYVVVTGVTWKIWSRKKRGIGGRILVGLIFGACSILSNHISINYGDMLLNVRDIGPLVAGLMFHPLSGVIAGVLGGVERWIIGEYFQLGEYTRVACAISTILAGILPIPLYYRVFRGRRPPAIQAGTLGAVMEVFHMYAVFITHRSDIRMVYEIVRVVAFPMIAFTALGVAGCSLVIKHLSGEKASFGYFRQRGEIPLSHQFQFWLLMMTVVVSLFNFAASYSMQTQSALEDAQYRLDTWTETLRVKYQTTQKSMQELSDYIYREQLRDTRVVSRTMERPLERNALTEEQLENIREVSGLNSLYVLSGEDGKVLMSAGDAKQDLFSLQPAGDQYVTLQDLLAGKAKETLLQDEDYQLYAVTPCHNDFLCTSADIWSERMTMDFFNPDFIYGDYELPPEAKCRTLLDNGELAFFFDNEKITDLDEKQLSLLREHRDGVLFETDLFGEPALCACRELEKSENVYVLVMYPVNEAFADRDAQIYEYTFSDVLMFAMIYLMITILMERMVVQPLVSVNASLQKITGGNLTETVKVDTSAEFRLLSGEINMTVEALRGYIDAAEKRIEQELQMARAIQESSLPGNFRFPRSDFELYATMDPAKQVGGDFYDFFFVGPDSLALVIADVSGKGIPAALFMMRSKTTIRGLAESGLSPSEIFSRANNILCDGNDAEMFVTAWMGIVDLKTGRMECANAGHEYPMLCRKGEKYELYKDKHDLVLGAMEGIPMREYTLQLNPGDRLYVYTDGVPEAINEQQEQYGTERLGLVLNANLSLSQEQLLPLIRQDIRDFAGKAEQFDDITMLGFVWTPGETA